MLMNQSNYSKCQKKKVIKLEKINIDINSNIENKIKFQIQINQLKHSIEHINNITMRLYSKCHYEIKLKEKQLLKI